MRAVVKVKQSQGQTASNATRYIAGSKLNPEREGERPRPLFTNKGHDNLTYRRANSFLTSGAGSPIKNDLIHFSVSFLNEDFEALGSGDEERKQRLREAAREAMDEFRSDLRVGDWRWVAGIHLNTPYPHMHFLAFKEVTGDKGKPHRLGRIPKRLLAYQERSPDGSIAAVEGKLGEHFVTALDRAQQRARHADPEREGQDMAQTLLSNTLEFDSPLVHQGIEYRTVENFYQAMKTPREDIETRRKIAAASPGEARALVEREKMRPDWPEIRLQVLETALRHKFAPGTTWHDRLMTTGEREIRGESAGDHLGRLLMKIRKEGRTPSIEILLEANRRNPSPAGRELVQELILRGPAPEPDSPPEALIDIREALKNRQLNDPYYNSQPGKADWLGEHSQELRDIYERGATIKDNVLVIPAEEHELNNLTADRAPFINEHRYAHKQIRDPQRATEFYTLAKTIAGKTANTQTEIKFFSYYYDLTTRESGDENGRRLERREMEARAEALDLTLDKMREMAPVMEVLETHLSIETQKAHLVDSFEEIREVEAASRYDDEEEHLPDLPGLPDLESPEPDHMDEEAVLNDAHEDERESERREPEGSVVFNISARKVDLSDESLRFPAGLTFEERKSLIAVHLPNLDAKLESGRSRIAVLGDINRMVQEWNRHLPEDRAALQKESDKNHCIGSFLKAYTNERLKDPETRALNAAERFRDAHERITETGAPEELNQAANQILRGNGLGWRERALIFFGRAPAHHTSEMRELRYSWGLSRDERAAYAKALHEGKREPSPVLEKMLADLESRTSARGIRHYRASIINREMQNPGKLDLYGMRQRLPTYEWDYLFGKIGEKERGLSGRHPSLHETAPELDTSGPPPVQVSPGSESHHEYTAALAEIEQRLLDEAIGQKQPTGKGGNEAPQAEGLLSREDRLRIRAIAGGLAWERLEPQRIMTNDPAVMKLLSLGEAVARLRDETQPRAREATRQVDEFIRSRALDRLIERKTDYYYRGDQIPRGEVEKLSPDDQRAFAALEAHSSATLGELKDGFSRIDKIKLEIDEARNGKGDPGTRKGANGTGKQAPAQTADRAAGANQKGSLPERDATIDRERLNDRRILGDVIIAHALADCAVLDYETARNHGHTFRFNIRDESLAANRRISDLDVHRRAGARAARAADERGAGRQEDRLAIRGQVSEADIHYHSTTLAEHGKKLDSLVNKLESNAKDALDAYRHARQLAVGVIEKYQEREEPIPAPLVRREALVEAQDEAIKHRFAGHTEKFERLRVALAKEHGQPARSDQEAARLAAQVFSAGAEAHAREERARRFDETRHLRQWEIGDEKFSLAEIDRRVERLTDTAAVFGRYELHLDPGSRKAASAEIERLGRVRQEVLEKTGERQVEMRESVSEAHKLLDTLAHAYGRESALREQSGLPVPAPRFTREELERASDNIESARDAAGLRQLSVFERQFNAYADPNERFKPAEGWGRAPARTLVAEIFHRENNERLIAFEQRGEIQPLLVETPDGRLITHRLQDTGPQSLFEQIARPLIETDAQRELRHGVEAAFAQYENRLKTDFDETRAYMGAAR